MEFSFSELVQRCGLPHYTVRYRVMALGLGRKVNQKLRLFSDSDVEKIVNFRERNEDASVCSTGNGRRFYRKKDGRDNRRTRGSS